MTKISHAIFYLTLFSLTSCSLFKKDLRKHPVAQFNYWNDFKSLPLEKRISKKANKDIHDYTKTWKSSVGIDYKNIATDKVLTEKPIKHALSLIPKLLYDFLDKNVISINIVDELNIPIAVLPLTDNKKFMIFLDSKINTMGLNDWYLWREYSAFNVKGENIDLEAFLSHTNNQTDTLHFLFSQAIALIISWDEKIFPRDFEKAELSQVPFINRSWLNDKGVIESKHERVLDEIKFLSFYGRSAKSFSDEKIYEFYKRLEKTNFTNLYSTTGPLRDFIESMAMYIHVFYFQRPFNLDFYEHNTLLDSFTHCLNRPRCLNKKKDIKDILDKFL